MRLIYMFLLTLFVASNTARAGVVEYETEDREQWFADAASLSDTATIDFTGFANNTNITDQYAPLGVTFEGLNFVTGPSGSFNDAWGLRIFDGNHLYFDEPINWIAADIVGPIWIDLYVDDILIYESSRLGSGGISEFGGLLSNQPFNHARLYRLSGPLTVLDDLYFGPIIAVPTPGALAVILLTPVLACRHRRR